MAVGDASLAGLGAAGDRRVDRLAVGGDRLRLAVGAQRAQLVEARRRSGVVQPRQRPLDQLAFGIALAHLLQRLGGRRGGARGSLPRGPGPAAPAGAARRRRGCAARRGRRRRSPAGRRPRRRRPVSSRARWPIGGGRARNSREGLVEGLAGGPRGLRRVEHAEAGVDPGGDRVAGQQAVAEAVDRRHPGAADRGEQLAGALGAQLRPAAPARRGSAGAARRRPCR